MSCGHTVTPAERAEAIKAASHMVMRAYAITLPSIDGTFRFFHSVSRRGRVITAWCLAGAKLFQVAEVDRIVEDLTRRGKKPAIVEVIAAV